MGVDLITEVTAMAKHLRESRGYTPKPVRVTAAYWLGRLLRDLDLMRKERDQAVARLTAAAEACDGFRTDGQTVADGHLLPAEAAELGASVVAQDGQRGRGDVRPVQGCEIGRVEGGGGLAPAGGDRTRAGCRCGPATRAADDARGADRRASRNRVHGLRVDPAQRRMVMTWKSSPEAVIEHPNGDRIKVSWSDLITVELCCTYAGGNGSEDEDVAVSIDVTALPHLLLALQHCLDVARLEGCFEEEDR